MLNIPFAFYIALEIISWVIFVDVILSWLIMVIGIKRPQFIADLLDPLYNFVKKHIKTTIGMFDLTPIIVLIILMLLQALIMILFPGNYSLKNLIG